MRMTGSHCRASQTTQQLDGHEGFKKQMVDGTRILCRHESNKGANTANGRMMLDLGGRPTSPNAGRAKGMNYLLTEGAISAARLHRDAQKRSTRQTMRRKTFSILDR